MDFKDWDIDTLDKHILNLIHNEPESATKLRGIEQTQVHKNSKLVGSQRILNFVSGAGFDAVNRPEKESIDISLPVSSGIQFDTAPQIGDWLSIRTIGTAPVSVAYTNGMSIGMWSHDLGDGSYPGGIDLLADRPSSTPNEFYVGAMNEYGIGIACHAHDGLNLWNISNVSTGDLWIRQQASSGDLRLDCDNGDINAFANQTMFLGGKFGNFNFSGTPIADAFKLITTAGKMHFIESSGHGMLLEGDVITLDTTSGTIHLHSDRIDLNTVGGINGDIQLNAGKGLIFSSATTNINLTANTGTVLSTAQTITFNSFTQKVTVTTLANVIALLQSYGLAA